MADRRMRENSSIATLPIEILFNILIHLPITHLLQIKSVCKSWYFLITSREFANHHLRRNSLSSDRHLLFSGEFESLYSVNLETLESPTVKIAFPPKSERYGRKKIVGSCNGLILCICDEFTFNFEGLLLNSSSLPCKKIPKLELPLNCMYINYGFGYDCSTDDYKVIRIVHFLLGKLFCRNSMEVMVYSLRDDSWKSAKNNFPVYWTPKSLHGVLVNNNLLHWLFPCSSDSNVYRIACFDVSSEKWSEVPMIDQTFVKPPVELGVLDGCLCLLIGLPYMGLDVWVMEEYGVKDSWVKLFKFKDWPVIRSLCIPPIAYSQDGSKILVKRDESSKVCWYNIREKRVAEIEIRGLIHNRGLSTCIRTLICPCRNDQISDET